MKGWTHISVSLKTLKELDEVIRHLRNIGIPHEPNRKKYISYDRAIKELIKLYKNTQIDTFSHSKTSENSPKMSKRAESYSELSI